MSDKRERRPATKEQEAMAAIILAAYRDDAHDMAHERCHHYREPPCALCAQEEVSDRRFYRQMKVALYLIGVLFSVDVVLAIYRQFHPMTP